MSRYSSMESPADASRVLDEYLAAMRGTLLAGVVLVDKTLLVDILKHQYRSCNDLQRVKDQVGKDAIGGFLKVQQPLETVERNLATIRQNVVNVLGCDPLAMAPSQRSAQKADEVFRIPELAEMILLNLDAEQLLSTMSTNRALAAAISSSLKIQMKLGLRPDCNAAWRSNFEPHGDKPC